MACAEIENYVFSQYFGLLCLCYSGQNVVISVLCVWLSLSVCQKWSVCQHSTPSMAVLERKAHGRQWGFWCSLGQMTSRLGCPGYCDGCPAMEPPTQAFPYSVRCLLSSSQDEVRFLAVRIPPALHAILKALSYVLVALLVAKF